MMYLLLLAGGVLLLLYGPKLRKQAKPALAVLFAGLLFLWISYFFWNNPSGDPQGSMFRGLELLALLAASAILGLAALTQVERRTPTDTPAKPRSKGFIVVVLIVAAAFGYLALTYLR